MEEINEFFRTGERIILEGSETGGLLPLTVEEIDEVQECYREPFMTLEDGTDYAQFFRQQEEVDQEEKYESNVAPNEKTCMEELTSMGEVNDPNQLQDNIDYVKNKFTCKPQPNLSITKEKDNILMSIEAHSVTVIQGPTGCGKTTQVPQWILEEYYKQRKFCNIIVTQPRRIAAISIARRVCDMNNITLGDLVGYQVALESKLSNQTQLQYVTTGVLLQRLVNTRDLNKYTHIILDEVHERNQDMDFLLVVVKKLLRKAKCVKVILMSATFNAERFSEFFSIQHEKAPAIEIPKEREHKIHIYYLDTISILGKLPDMNYDIPGMSRDMYLFTLKLINAFEEMDLSEARNLREMHSHAPSTLSNQDSNTNDEDENDYPRPCILIFLPGIFEIEQLFNTLNDHKLREDLNPTRAKLMWQLLPLHSTITIEEQVRVFLRPPPKHRKIILATNIAESSITVPDIKYVIDFCLMKILKSNSETNFSTLQLSWASKSNCMQRAGRSGRVREGKVYRMINMEFYESLDEDCEPEMRRCPLDNLVLSAKLLNMGSPAGILSLTMDPPDMRAVGRSMFNLKQIGALLKTVNGQFSITDGDITFIGRVMAKLPLDTRISKLIILGYVFGCLEECIIIGGAMSVRNVFSTPFRERMTAYSTKLTWADGSGSDCIALLGAYKAYQRLNKGNFFATKNERKWAKSLYLQINALREMDILIRELKHRLQGEEIWSSPSPTLWKDFELPFVLKVLIAGAFYPFYFAISRMREGDEPQAFKILGDRDPKNTVYFSQMDQHQPIQLYAANLKEALKDCSKEDIVISSDNGGSSKVYVTFLSETGLVPGSINEPCSLIPGKVALPVYKAVKMRQLKIPVTLMVMPRDQAQKAAEKLDIRQMEPFGELDLLDIKTRMLLAVTPRLPDLDENYVDIYVTHIVDCGHFWSQYADNHSQSQLKFINSHLDASGTLRPIQGHANVGVMYVARYQESDKKFTNHRVKITRFLENDKVLVRYIDYGNSAIINDRHLMCITGKHEEELRILRALAFECILTEIGPSLVRDSRGLWTNEAIREFTKLTTDGILTGKVYSVAHCVASLKLHKDNLFINDYLISEGYAAPIEESYTSRANRTIRDSFNTLQPSEQTAKNKEQARKSIIMDYYHKIPPPPDPMDCRRRLTLSGPFSPLETKIFSLMYAGTNKSVSVQWDSVNSVILDSNLQEPCERLLVAANIDQSSLGDHVTLRNTTLLPNIPGLSALVALIFSPVAQLCPDLTFTKYSAVLCGLGHFGGKPLFPEHDLYINIDADFTIDDIRLVNMVRYFMDAMLLTEGTQATPSASEEDRITFRKKIKDILQSLLFTRRKYRDPGVTLRKWDWNVQYPGMELEANNTFGDRAIFPPHDGLQLQEMDFDILLKQAVANKQIHEMCNGISKDIEVECALCKTHPLTLTNMKIHLASRTHREREQELPPVDDRFIKVTDSLV